jgi:hypothetical protein
MPPLSAMPKGNSWKAILPVLPWFCVPPVKCADTPIGMPTWWLDSGSSHGISNQPRKSLSLLWPQRGRQKTRESRHGWVLSLGYASPTTSRAEPQPRCLARLLDYGSVSEAAGRVTPVRSVTLVQKLLLEGSINQNVDPLPGTLSTPTRPP